MANSVLYSYYRSSCSWRVRIVLALKGIKYETKPVNILKNEINSDWFLKINSMGQVPALVIDGHTLVQSASIMEYIEETRPEPRLLPEDLVQRAIVRSICELIGSGIQPLQNISALHEFEEECRQEKAQKVINKGFGALEQMLKTTSGKYCVGDTVTLADCYIVPQLYNANRFKVDMSKYPIISRIVGALELLPEFTQSHPHSQPDCPPALKG